MPSSGNRGWRTKPIRANPNDRLQQSYPDSKHTPRILERSNLSARCAAPEKLAGGRAFRLNARVASGLRSDREPKHGLPSARAKQHKQQRAHSSLSLTQPRPHRAMDEFDSFLDDGKDDLFHSVDYPLDPAQSEAAPLPEAGPSFIRPQARRQLGGDKDKDAYDETEFGGFAAFVEHKRRKLHYQRMADVNDLRAGAAQAEDGTSPAEIGSNMFRSVSMLTGIAC